MKNIFHFPLTGSYLLFLSLLCCLMVAPDAMAQKISVLSMERTTEPTANMAGTTVLDQNNEKCALLRFQTTVKDLNFDFGSFVPMKIDREQPGEIWVWISPGVKKMTLRHDVLGNSRPFKFPEPTRTATTYIVNLTANKVSTVSYDKNKKAPFVLYVYPADAEVSINGTEIPVENGRVETNLHLGTHTFLVSAPRYHEREDTVTLTQENQNVTRSVRLKPTFGWLTFSNLWDLDQHNTSTNLYIDGQSQGACSRTPLIVEPGKHGIRLTKPLYETYEDLITITEGDTLILAPELVNNYGYVNCKVRDPEAEILIDGISQGKGPLINQMVGVGKHTLQANLPYHRSYSKEIEVSKALVNEIKVPALEPILSAVDLRTDDAKMDVYIDGEKVGQTPYNAPIIIGPHHVELKGRGYRNEAFNIEVMEGVPFTKDVPLTAAVEVDFDLSPSYATLFIDDETNSSRTALLNTGRHRLKVVADGYYDKSLSRNFQKDGERVSIHLRPIFFQKYDWYFDLGGNFGAWLGGRATLGGYFGCFNIDASVDVWGKPKEMETYYPLAEKYSGVGLTGTIKMGYGFSPLFFMKITPQVGATYGGLLKPTESKREYGEHYNEIAFSSFTAGVKFNFGFSRHFGIWINPYYNFRIYGTEQYKILADESDKVKQLAEGFNLGVGIYLK